MLKFRTLILASAIVAALPLAVSAKGWNTVVIKNTPTEKQLQGTCKAVGGHFRSGPGYYSCTNNCAGDRGCSVDCKSDGGKTTCTGTTPARTTKLVGTHADLKDLLNAKASDFDPQPEPPRPLLLDNAGTFAPQGPSVMGTPMAPQAPARAVLQ